jgi:hypothetical protein
VERKSAVRSQTDAIDPERKSDYGTAIGASNSMAFAISAVAVQLRVSQIVNAIPDKCQISIRRSLRCFVYMTGQ